MSWFSKGNDRSEDDVESGFLMIQAWNLKNRSEPTEEELANLEAVEEKLDEYGWYHVDTEINSNGKWLKKRG